MSQALLFGILILFLIVGLSYKKGPQTIREYALGNKKLSTSVLIYTMVATVFGGGSVIGFSAALYQHGAWLFLALLAIPISNYILSLTIVPKLSKYYGCISMAEIMGKMYGSYARRFVGIVAFVFCLGILAAQIRALYWVMEHVFVQHALIATITGVLILTLYSSMGGVASVIKTDVVQFFIFIGAIPAIATVACYVIYTSGGISQIAASIPESKLALYQQGNIFGFISVILFHLVPDVSPVFFHRFLIGRDCQKNQATLYAVAIVNLLNIIAMGCIAFIAMSQFPSTEPQNVIFVVIQNIITSKFIIILFAIALISMITSTADSLINTGSILLVNDVITNKITEAQKIKLVKLVTILSGLVALLFAYIFSTRSSVADMILLFAEYYTVIVFIPLISGLFLNETRQEAFWISAPITFVTFSFLHLEYPGLKHAIFLFSSVASLSSYLLAHLYFRTKKIQGLTFSLINTCNNIVQSHTIRTGALSLISLWFATSIIFGNATGPVNTIELACGGIALTIGMALFFLNYHTFKYKNVFILGIIWYCIAFFPTYTFLNQKAEIFTINFIISLVLLSRLFSLDVFLTFLLSGSLLSAVLLCFSDQPLASGSITKFMHLGLLISGIGATSYIAFGKGLGFILSGFRSKKRIASESVYNNLLDATQISLEADTKYKFALLRDHKTEAVALKDIKDNLLAYFQHMSVINKTEISFVNSEKKVFITTFPMSLFYQFLYSLIVNVFYAGQSEKIKIKFHCDNKETLQIIEINHGKFKLEDKLPEFKGAYPHSILKWDRIKEVCHTLSFSIHEGINTLSIILPPDNAPPAKSNVINLKGLVKS